MAFKPYVYSAECVLHYLKASKKEYHQEKAAICDTIREIYHSRGGNVGHRFMKVFLEKNIYLSKTSIHKYMNQEMYRYYVPRRKKTNNKKFLQY